MGKSHKFSFWLVHEFEDLHFNEVYNIKYDEMEFILVAFIELVRVQLPVIENRVILNKTKN